MMLPVLLLITGTIIGDVSATLKHYSKTLENENFEDKFSLLGPRNLIQSHKTIAGVFEDEVAENDTCGRDLVIMNEAIARRETWALKMLDASSKIPSGLLEGNIIDLGMFDECMGVKGESEGVEIRGHHCMYTIALSSGSNAILPISPTLSICMPSTCNVSDIIDLFNATISSIDRLKDLGITVTSATCTDIDKEIWDTEFIICFSVLMVFIGLLLFCTLCDVILQFRDAGEYRHPTLSTLAKFSLIKSTSSILDTRTREGTLPAIHGIRFLSMGWVVLGHEYIMHIAAVNVNTVGLLSWVESWKSLYIFTAPFAVDTFFTMSGFLMTYMFIKQMPRQKSFNIPMYYLHRYFRLTPAVIALTVFTIVFVPKIGSGPRWDSLISLFGGCRQKWWPNLLYVQNFVEKENACLGHLWYLAVDMQLFWISPIILYPLYKKPKLGLFILLSLFLASLVVPGVIVGINKYPTFSFIHGKDLTSIIDVFTEVYEKPYTRAGPWLVGILLGYDVAHNNRRHGKLAVSAGWLVAVGVFAFCTFGTRSFMEPSYEYDVIWESFFTAVSRPLWAVGVCWIIYACVHNYAGPVSTILSCKLFLPLSRVSYCVYLVHMVIQTIQQAAQKIPNFYSDSYIWHDYLSDLIKYIVAGFFFSLLFESPIMVLEKMLLRRKRENINESERHFKSEESKSEQA